MADRYWVGGAGAWNNSSTANWSASSGGASGASVPTAADSVIFDQAGTYTVTMAGTLLCLNLTVSLGTVTFATGSTHTLAITGNMTLLVGTVWSATGTITFNATTTGKTITTNGVTISASIAFNGVGGEWTLGSAFTSTSAATLTNGTLNLQSYTLTATTFNSSNSNARTLAFGTGNITVNGTGTVWSNGVVTNLTVTGTPTVNVSNTTATATTVAPGSPTEANSISFNFTTGTYALTFSAGSVRDLNFTGFAGTMASNAKTIYGNVTLAAAYTAGANVWTFAATSGTKTITPNAFTIDWPLTFNGVGGTWQLQGALTMGSTRAFTHTNGTLNLNGQTLTVGSSYTTATGTKNLTFNAGTLVCPAASATAFNNAAPTGFSTTAGTGTGTISMTAATAKTFVGGGSTFNCTLNQGGAGALTITGANTFTNIANTVQPASVLFTAATTNTFTNFNLNGSAGNLITIGSVTAASHTLSKASGAVWVDYVSISRSTATGGSTWATGVNSVNGGNNTGWVFGGLLPALFTNTNTFYTPAVVAGSVTLTPALFTNTNTFYSATLRYDQFLYPALFTNTNTFYAPTVVVTLTPALFTNTNTFYSATLRYNQFLYPALFTNPNTFYNTFAYLYPFHPNNIRANMPLSSSTRQPMPYE